MAIKMKIAYIAHPIGGNVKENLSALRTCICDLNMMYPNVVPFVPYYGDVVSMDDSNPVDRKRGIRNNMALLTRKGMIDELWVCGDKITEGMKEEILVAQKMNIPIKAMFPMLHNDLAAFLISIPTVEL